MFNTQNAQQAPYRQAGYSALGQILQGFGVPTGDFYGSIPGGGGGAPVMPTKAQFTSSGGPSLQLGGGEGGGIFYSAGGDGTFDQAAYDQAVADYQSKKAAWDASQGQQGGVPSGYFSHQFGANDLNANMAPNWQFALAQGQGAAKNALNLTGGLGGNFGKGLVDYTLNKSGDLYQQAYNNYTANQSNIFNRLSTVAGLGSAANSQSSQLAGSLAPSIASTIQGAGAAQAAGMVGSANAINQGAGNALGWYKLSDMIGGGGGASLGQEMVPGQYGLGNPAYG